MSKIRLFAVIGDPIGHSRSPLIFDRLFYRTGLNAAYLRLAAPSAAAALESAAAMSLAGLNVTAPFKQEITGRLAELRGPAAELNTVNTLVRDDAGWIGHNTDVDGVLTPLRKRRIDLVKRRVIILGAGGAAQAALYAVRHAGAERILLANRSPVKARRLAEQWGCETGSIEAALQNLGPGDVLISCLPLSLTELKGFSPPAETVVLQADYRFPGPGGHSGFISGLEWLFHQAVSAFEIFTGRKIPAQAYPPLLADLFQDDRRAKPHVALMGFMGSGKTTVGRMLAERLGWEFVDTDSLIEEQAGLSIYRIFRDRGEKAFRDMERKAVQQVLRSSAHSVIALGGGAVLDEANLALIRNRCWTVWLWVSVRAALQRIDPGTRPLLEASPPTESAAEILSGRIPVYARTCDLVIDTETVAEKAAAERVQHEMDQAF
jgi:shikimate dehydrogenase